MRGRRPRLCSCFGTNIVPAPSAALLISAFWTASRTAVRSTAVVIVVLSDVASDYDIIVVVGTRMYIQFDITWLPRLRYQIFLGIYGLRRAYLYAHSALCSLSKNPNDKTAPWCRRTQITKYVTPLQQGADFYNKTTRTASHEKARRCTRAARLDTSCSGGVVGTGEASTERIGTQSLRQH